VLKEYSEKLRTYLEYLKSPTVAELRRIQALEPTKLTHAMLGKAPNPNWLESITNTWERNMSQEFETDPKSTCEDPICKACTAKLLLQPGKKPLQQVQKKSVRTGEQDSKNGNGTVEQVSQKIDTKSGTVEQVTQKIDAKSGQCVEQVTQKLNVKSGNIEEVKETLKTNTAKISKQTKIDVPQTLKIAKKFRGSLQHVSDAVVQYFAEKNIDSDSEVRVLALGRDPRGPVAARLAEAIGRLGRVC
jgi:hypothetical protein